MSQSSSKIIHGNVLGYAVVVEWKLVAGYITRRTIKIELEPVAETTVKMIGDRVNALERSLEMKWRRQ